MSNFFEEFEKVDYQKWLDKATKDLKGINPEEQYTIHLSEELLVNPYYDSSSQHYEGLNISHLLIERPYDPWYNVHAGYLENGNTNTNILNALKSGSNGVKTRKQEESDSLSSKLAQVLPQHCYLNFEGYAMDEILEFLTTQISSNDRSEVYASITKRTDQEFTQSYLQGVLQGASKLSEFPNIRNVSFSINAKTESDFFNDLAQVLAQFVELATISENIAIFELFNRTVITSGVSNNYFFEIAKLRAIRIVFDQLAKQYDVSGAKVFIQSEGRIGTDELQNLLSNTTQGMSSIIGTADAILLEPNKGLPDEDAFRIARNISILLKEESKLDKVKDPAAGAYYIDSMTNAIVENTWRKFLAIENNGGYFKTV